MDLSIWPNRAKNFFFLSFFFLSFFLSSSNASVGRDFNQLPVVVGPSNLVCIFYGTFPRGVFRKIGPHYPHNRIPPPFSLFPPLSVGHNFDQLPIGVGPSNLVCIFYGTFPRGVLWKIGTHYPLNIIISPFTLIHPLSIGYNFNQLLIGVRHSNLVCIFCGTFPKVFFFTKSDPTSLKIEINPLSSLLHLCLYCSPNNFQSSIIVWYLFGIGFVRSFM